MSWVDALLGIGTQIGGALIGANANRGAADTVAQSNERAAQIYADAQREAARTAADAQARGPDEDKQLVDQAIAEATRYNEQAKATYARMAAESEPAVAYLRNVVASNPYELTPQQQAARAGTLRNANASLAASGLRGAGRSGQAVLNKAVTDFDN